MVREARNIRPYAFVENVVTYADFYEKAGYNSSDKTAFIQWIGMDE